MNIHVSPLPLDSSHISGRPSFYSYYVLVVMGTHTHPYTLQSHTPLADRMSTCIYLSQNMHLEHGQDAARIDLREGHLTFPPQYPPCLISQYLTFTSPPYPATYQGTRPSRGNNGELRSTGRNHNFGPCLG